MKNAMKQLLAPLVIALVLLILSNALLGGGVAHAAQRDAETQDPALDHPKWEYEVVGLSDIYGSTLDYLKGAFEGDKKDLLELAKRTDDQLVAKTRDLLNEYGGRGWELAEYRENVLVFKRRAR